MIMAPPGLHQMKPGGQRGQQDMHKPGIWAAGALPWGVRDPLRISCWRPRCSTAGHASRAAALVVGLPRRVPERASVGAGQSDRLLAAVLVPADRKSTRLN